MTLQVASALGLRVSVGRSGDRGPCARRTFLLNRERAVDYLNMLDRIYVFDGFAGWDPEVRKHDAPFGRIMQIFKPLPEVQHTFSPN